MEKLIKDFIKKSLEEDIGKGDLTSNACIKKEAIGEAKLITKESCYISGINLAKKIYSFYDEKLIFSPNIQDGEFAKKNEVVFKIYGNKRAILATERLILNCMQRMSSITTKTKKFVKEVENHNVKILDTRKTCPSIRFLDKEAVKLGGGYNHRFGLFDVMMIKDNHIDFAGGVAEAIRKTKQYLKEKNKHLEIIVEARNLEEVHEVLSEGGVKRILLDNFDYETTKKAVEIIGNKCQTESSGGITEKTISEYAKCGVDYISVGALTHSISNFDLSLKAF